MHKEILNTKQTDLLPILEYFSKKGFYLAGGTALALQVGHRESIDFDLFSYNSFKNEDIVKDLKNLLPNSDIKVVIDVLDEYTCVLDGVKITFLRYPFDVKDIKKVENINLADKLTIGAMKAYALGRRSKWKDYVDIYTLLQEFSIEDICSKAEEIFGTTFSSKLFLQQLSYFKDIDYTEVVTWRIDNPPQDKDIEKFLVKASVDI